VSPKSVASKYKQQGRHISFQNQFSKDVPRVLLSVAAMTAVEMNYQFSFPDCCSLSIMIPLLYFRLGVDDLDVARLLLGDFEVTEEARPPLLAEAAGEVAPLLLLRPLAGLFDLGGLAAAAAAGLFERAEEAEVEPAGLLGARCLVVADDAEAAETDDDEAGATVASSSLDGVPSRLLDFPLGVNLPVRSVLAFDGLDAAFSAFRSFPSAFVLLPSFRRTTPVTIIVAPSPHFKDNTSPKRSLPTAAVTKVFVAVASTVALREPLRAIPLSTNIMPNALARSSMTKKTARTAYSATSQVLKPYGSTAAFPAMIASQCLWANAAGTLSPPKANLANAEPKT
jgi:hypothetical protein